MIEEYYKKDCLPYLDKSLDIYIDCDQLWTKADICVFSYGRYLDEDDVLTDVDLVYLYDPDVPFTGQDNTEVIKLDKHWRIVVEDFYY